MDPSRQPPAFPPSRGDIAYAAFYSGAIGGSVIALLFLLVDAFRGRPFFTPGLLGSVLFEGRAASEVLDPGLASVALFTGVHFVAFAALGLLATLVFLVARASGTAPTVATGIALFSLMEGGMLVASATLMPGVVPALGHAAVLAANLLTAVAMALFVRSALSPPRVPSDEPEEELVERPGF